MNKFSIEPIEIEKQREFTTLAGEILLNSYVAPKAFVHSFGCQGNVSDGERIKGILRAIGYTLTEEIGEADFILYNTCAVREHAQDRVFGNVGALKALKRAKKGLIIALCGCMMQQEHVADKIKKSYPFVNIVFGTHTMYKLPEYIYTVLRSGWRVCDIPGSEGVIVEDIPVSRDSTFKAFVPIMYGCNNFCTYCIVPYVRGRERSRDPEAILKECRELIEKGYKEINLIGQNVNSYGKDPDYGCSFASLLRQINAIPGDFIIRFMTSHPKDCTRELIDTIAACEKAAHHLHLPVQSGSDEILRRMNRKYTSSQYLELLKLAYEKIPDLSVTTDIIIGFPGETREDFLKTAELVKKANYTSMYEFIYSPREGTAAAKMPDPITREEKGEWFRELQLIQEEIAQSRTAAMLGKTYRVLCERMNKFGLLEGRTGGNVMIEFPGDESLIGEFVPVKVTEALTWVLKGELAAD